MSSILLPLREQLAPHLIALLLAARPGAVQLVLHSAELTIQLLQTRHELEKALASFFCLVITLLGSFSERVGPDDFL
jgi:hypothetical protein